MRFATTGQTNSVVPVAGNYLFSPEDAIASIQAAWTGGTITLPGPGAGSPATTGAQNPANGDTYEIADPQGKVTNSAQITINGGGYRFLSAGALTTVMTLTTLLSTTLAGQKSCITFIFDATANLWIVC